MSEVYLRSTNGETITFTHGTAIGPTPVLVDEANLDYDLAIADDNIEELDDSTAKQLIRMTQITQQVSQVGSNTTIANLGLNVVTMGQQTPQNVNGYSGMRLNIWGANGVTFSVNVQGQMYDGTWYTLPATVATVPTSTASAAAITAAGIYDFDVADFVQVALLVNSISGQSVGNGISAKGGFQP